MCYHKSMQDIYSTFEFNKIQESIKEYAKTEIAKRQNRKKKEGYRYAMTAAKAEPHVPGAFGKRPTPHVAKA